MSVVFENSPELKKIIEKHRWSLYDTTLLKGDVRSSWEQLNQMGPADNFQIRHHYMFIPALREGKTCEETYAESAGLGPSLSLPPDVDNSKGLQGKRGIALNGFNLYLFSRLFFESKNLVATSPDGLYLPKAPIFSIPYSRVVGVFERYFAITTRNELQASLLLLQPTILN